MSEPKNVTPPKPVDADVEGLRALLAAATPGPWSAEDIPSIRRSRIIDGEGNAVVTSKGGLTSEDAEVIAYLVTYAGALLDELTRLRADRDRATTERDDEEARRMALQGVLSLVDEPGKMVECAEANALTASRAEVARLRDALERLADASETFAGSDPDMPGFGADEEAFDEALAYARDRLLPVPALGSEPAGGEVPRCGKYLGDNDGTCPQLTCIRERGHDGLCDNVNAGTDAKGGQDGDR